jgi:two-component system sensor kinase FixL
MRDGRWHAGMYVNHATVRRWTEEEAALVRDVAEQTWDAVERARAVQALRTSEARLRLAHEVTGMGTWEWDPETGEHLWTPEQYALFGLDPVHVGPLTFARAVAEVVHADDRARVEAALHGAAAAGRTVESVFRAWRRRPNGGREMRWIIARGSRVRRADGSLGRMLGVTMDITERQASEARLQELQAELLHVSRLSAAGEMASALAHELNQPLTAATSAIQAVRRMLARSPPGAANGPAAEVREAVDLAAEQALWAGRIVRRLRDFVARGETEKRLEELPRLVEEASALALAGAKERLVHVAFRLEPGLRRAVVDAIQIQQVLFNLIRNAVEAMTAEGDRGDGAPTRCRDLVVSTAPAGPGMVEVAVSDSGPGLAPEVAGRLFEPFVSTKPNGMGVGLSICRSIVEAHGGRLWAEPNAGGGTVFRFTLPSAPSPEVAACLETRDAAR